MALAYDRTIIKEGTMKNKVLYILLLFCLVNIPSVYAQNAVEKSYFIEISISRCRLYLYEKEGEKLDLIREYKVATAKRGLEVYPIGLGKITRIELFPYWYPTAYSRWYFKTKKGINLPAKVPPGDKLNYMGDVKIHLSHTTRKGSIYRIHGNNDSSLVGTRATGGCFRMYNDEGVELAKIIKVETPVSIVK